MSTYSYFCHENARTVKTVKNILRTYISSKKTVKIIQEQISGHSEIIVAKPDEDGKFCAPFIRVVRSLAAILLLEMAENQSVAQALKELILTTFSHEIPGRGQPSQ